LERRRGSVLPNVKQIVFTLKALMGVEGTVEASRRCPSREKKPEKNRGNKIVACEKGAGHFVLTEVIMGYVRRN